MQHSSAVDWTPFPQTVPRRRRSQARMTMNVLGSQPQYFGVLPTPAISSSLRLEIASEADHMAHEALKLSLLEALERTLHIILRLQRPRRRGSESMKSKIETFQRVFSPLGRGTSSPLAASRTMPCRPSPARRFAASPRRAGASTRGGLPGATYQTWAPCTFAHSPSYHAASPSCAHQIIRQGQVNQNRFTSPKSPNN
jgi:hypothetical protein